MDHSTAICRINNLTGELDSVYHLSSLKLGITDSVSRVLYAIYETGNQCMLSDICKKTGISKQTINSAIRKLESDGILYLRPCGGRTKKVILTESGKEYVNTTAARLFRAESDAFSTWTEEEIATHIRLMEKYIQCFRQEVKKL